MHIREEMMQTYKTGFVQYDLKVKGGEDQKVKEAKQTQKKIKKPKQYQQSRQDCLDFLPFYHPTLHAF